MAAIRENLVNNNRQRLEEVIPLRTPFSLAIDPCNLCNFRCEFCAAQYSDDKAGYIKQCMDLDLFKKIVDDLKEFDNKVKIIRLAGLGEPLINKDFCDMVKYLKDSDTTEWIETITNGSLLNHELNRKLADSGIDRIRISIEALDDIGYENITHRKVNYNKFVDNIADLYECCKGKCEIYIKAVDAALPTDNDKDVFYKTYEDICDRIFIDTVIPMWSDYKLEVKNKGVHGQKLQSVKICPFGFYSCVINPDGQVNVCCSDWKRNLIIGNVNDSSLKEIWNGEILFKFWLDVASGNKNNYEMCRKCVLPMYDCNDNIDEYGELIYDKLIKLRG